MIPHDWSFGVAERAGREFKVVREGFDTDNWIGATDGAGPHRHRDIPTFTERHGAAAVAIKLEGSNLEGLK